MKTFKELIEAREASIWDTKPKTLKDAEDPEIQLKWAKGGDYEWIENKMSSYHGLLEGIQEIEKQMSKPAWKKKITMLKRARK